MQEQIEFLIHATKYPNVRIQVLPTGSGGHTGVGNSFSMLRLRSKSLSDVVYLEQIESALFLGSPNESDPYDIARIGSPSLPAAPKKTHRPSSSGPSAASDIVHESAHRQA
jgi:hypothetical protein